MSEFSRFLSNITDRAVVDETALEGAFELESSFNPESIVDIRIPESSPLRNLPSFAEALRMDLGLKIETERRPVQMLRVERVEEPTEN